MRRTLLAVLALALASACTSTRVLTPTSPRPLEAPSTKILLMPLDVELLELAAGGVTSPRADWTAAARSHLQKSIVARIERARASHVVADRSLLADNSPHLQLFKLHETIGAAIYQYQAGGPNGQLPVLPTLKTGFDWTLGESVQPLGKDTGATHALFVKLTKQHLGWPLEPAFYVPEEAIQYFRTAVEHGKQVEADWNANFSAYQKAHPDLAREQTEDDRAASRRLGCGVARFSRRSERTGDPSRFGKSP